MKKIQILVCLLFMASVSFSQIKISALPASSGNVSGAVVAGVQGGVTKKIPVDSIAALSNTKIALKLNATALNTTLNKLPKKGVGDVLINSSIYDNAGNVGIGTIFPKAMLDVAGKGIFRDSLLSNINYIDNYRTNTNDTSSFLIGYDKYLGYKAFEFGDMRHTTSFGYFYNRYYPNIPQISFTTDNAGLGDIKLTGGVLADVYLASKYSIGAGTDVVANRNLETGQFQTINKGAVKFINNTVEDKNTLLTITGLSENENQITLPDTTGYLPIFFKSGNTYATANSKGVVDLPTDISCIPLGGTTIIPYAPVIGNIELANNVSIFTDNNPNRNEITFFAGALQLSSYDANQNAGATMVQSANGTIISNSNSNQPALQVSSQKAGFVPPRMTKATRNAMVSIANGSIIYQIDNNPGLRVYNAQTGLWYKFSEIAD
jgi:hypothetical protein